MATYRLKQEYKDELCISGALSSLKAFNPDIVVKNDIHGIEIASDIKSEPQLAASLKAAILTEKTHVHALERRRAAIKELVS